MLDNVFHMILQRWIVTPLACSLIAVSSAVAQCRVLDMANEIQIDCYNTTWSGQVIYDWNGWTGWYSVGYLLGGNECDPGGLSCDGTYRSSKVYKATKTFHYFNDPLFDQEVTFWWNISDQYLQWESCLYNDEPAWTVTNYSFTHFSGYYQLWCD